MFPRWETAGEQGTPGEQPEVVELPLLLPAGQLAELEAVARRRGLTSAQMIRHLVRYFLDSVPHRPPLQRT